MDKGLKIILGILFIGLIMFLAFVIPISIFMGS